MINVVTTSAAKKQIALSMTAGGNAHLNALIATSTDLDLRNADCARTIPSQLAKILPTVGVRFLAARYGITTTSPNATSAREGTDCKETPVFLATLSTALLVA